MTATDKEKIRYWRAEGLGGKAIAAKTGLTESAAKSFCRRDGGYDPSVCRQCGAALFCRKNCKPRKFCCDACCQAWWNSRPYLGAKKAVCQLTCAHCGQKFTSYGNQNRKFCGHPCYVAARWGKGENP